MFTNPKIPTLTDRPLISKSPRAEHSVTYEVSYDAWYGLARAYWHAGIRLVESCGAGDRKSAQLLTPAVFLIRHSVELHIKSQIRDASGQTWTEPTGKELEVLNGHSLSKLWRLLEDRLARLGGVQQDLWWERVRSIVSQLDQLDRTSMDFRYPVNKVGGVLTAGADITIDVQNFVEVLAELELMLEGTSAWIDSLRGAID